MECRYRRYDAYAAADATLPELGWVWGFTDPTWRTNPGGCEVPFEGSRYCSYGNELYCYVHGEGLSGGDIGGGGAADSARACQQQCEAAAGCEWFVWRSDEGKCLLKDSKGEGWACAGCAWGPKRCPHS